MSLSVISFSSRKDGNCAKIGKLIKSELTEVNLFDFSEFNLNACGSCSYQCFNGGKNCPFITDRECELLDAIITSTVTYFVIPNYCDFPCSNFFIFNERSLCYFNNNEKLLNKYLVTPKKFIVVSNNETDNFKTAFSYHCIGEPEILFLSAKKYGKVSIDGNITTSKQAIDDLLKFITK